MKQIRANSVGDCWFKAMRLVMNEGSNEQDGNIKIKEVLNLVLEVKVAKKDSLLNRYADKEMLDWMEDNFLSMKPTHYGYSYGSRLFDYYGIDQLDLLVKKLKKKPETKAATITFLKPKEDGGHVPCICLLDFKLRNNKLECSAYFRSQDIGKKVYADILCMRKIQEKIASKLKTNLGGIVIFIASAHIYQTDFKKVNSLLSSTGY